MKTTLKVILVAVLLAVVIFGLKKLGVPTSIFVGTIVLIAVILCGFVSWRCFKAGRKLTGAILAIGAMFVALVGIKATQIVKMTSTPFAMPPTAVSSAQVIAADWAPMLSSVGSISAVQGAELSTDLGGTVGQVNFQSGGEARKGDVLVKLVASQEEADLELARNDLARARDLAARKVISKAELDAAESKVKQKEGIVQHKEVRAPFDGQLGIRQVNVGEMIKEGQKVVQLTALDPVYIDFALPQQELAKLSPGLEVRVHCDALPGREFKGKLTAINAMVDPVTRNVTLQGTLENPDHALRPGMFAKVDLILPETHKTLVVPGSAISYAPYGDSVYVIEKQKDPKTGKESEVLRQQVVRVGTARGDLIAVTDGLKEGETIVSTGVFKLRNKMTVTINNDLAPKPQLNPTPADS